MRDHERESADPTLRTLPATALGEADIAAHELFAPPTSKQLTKRQEAAAILDHLLTENEGVVSVQGYTACAQDETNASESTIGRAVSNLDVIRFKLGDFEDKTWWIRRSNITEDEARKLARGRIGQLQLPPPPT